MTREIIFYVSYSAAITIIILVSFLYLRSRQYSELPWNLLAILMTVAAALLAAPTALYTLAFPASPELELKCETSRDFVPAEIKCRAITSDDVTVIWHSQGLPENVIGRDFSRIASEPGSYSIQVEASTRSLFRKVTQRKNVSILLKRPEPITPERITVNRSFSEFSRTPRAFAFHIPAEPFYKIVDASLVSTDQRDASGVRLIRTEREVEVVGMLNPPIRFEPFGVKRPEAFIKVTVLVTMEKIPR
jgi:hypothetical protein